MKIRHKQSGVVLEGQFCTMSEGNSLGSRTYYMQTGIGPHSQYDATEWEEVRPEWVDVSEQMLGVMNHLPVGHRFRKVHISEMEADMRKHAFIVEKKQS